MKAEIPFAAGFLFNQYTDFTLKPGLSLAFYPDLPLSISISGGALLEQSDYRETVLTIPIPRKNRIQPFVSADCGISLSDGITLSLSLPCKLGFYDYKSIRAAAFTDEQEWVLVLSPKAELAVTGGENLEWRFGLGAEEPFSNSDYLDAGYVEFSVIVVYTF